MPTSIIHAAEDTLYLAHSTAAQVGQCITQTRPVGALEEVFAAFHTQWKQRWCKHDNIPNSHWEQLVNFARASMPWNAIPPVVITPDLLRAEVASKKSRAATGLDGVSRADILQMDTSTLESLCSLYQRAGSDGSWPLQTVTGSVASLAKRDGAASTQDYRPITVFSMVYRAFSSLHARCMLDQANQWCHPDIYGNRKGHQTSQLWRVLVTSIQQAYDQNQCLSGLTADIEKCHNCLPRYPIIAAAVQVGTPITTMTAWCGALAAMTRRFKVRDSFSTGFTTSTGLAEGCALSCYGMLLMDDIMHRYVAAQYPQLRVLSFVDNWDFLTWNAQAATQQLDALLEFATLADLTVDRQKTYAWSTSATVRASLRAQGVPVRHAAKDLGAHVAFSRQHTNSTVTSRLEVLTPFWSQLRLSRASYKAKLRALRTVAWPRGLFAVESAPVSDNTWLAQRRHANKALGMDKPGVNPLLLLGLVEAYADPEFVALIKTVGETRLNCPLDFWATDLFPLAEGLIQSPPSSPTAVLLGRIQKIGIAVKPTGHWEDGIGLFHPASVNFAELGHRLQWQWNRYVSAAVSHRKGFHGLEMVDTTTTRQALGRLAVDDQCMLRLSLAGGLFTQDAHAHWNEGTGSCKWCGQPDSVYHRYYACPNTLDLRTKLAPNVLPLLDSLPDALVLRSWAIYPPTHIAWLRLLDSVPCSVPPLACALRLGELNHVFTDGSCLWQADPAYRVASWAAVLAAPCTNSWNFQHGGVLCAGHVPGLCQTSYRGELFALAVILHHAALGAFRVKVYCDCLGVVNKYHRLTTGRTALKPNSASSDLWTWVLASVAMMAENGCQVVKIPAHRKLTQAKGVEQKFGSFGITTWWTGSPSMQTLTDHRSFGSNGNNMWIKHLQLGCCTIKFVIYMWRLPAEVFSQMQQLRWTKCRLLNHDRCANFRSSLKWRHGVEMFRCSSPPNMGQDWLIGWRHGGDIEPLAQMLVTYAGSASCICTLITNLHLVAQDQWRWERNGWMLKPGSTWIRRSIRFWWDSNGSDVAWRCFGSRLDKLLGWPPAGRKGAPYKVLSMQRPSAGAKPVGMEQSTG